jgi:hypothetical protein
MKGNTVLLIIILVALGGSLYMSYSNLQQVHMLRQENSMLWEKLDSVQQIVNKKSVKQKAAPATTQSTGSPFLDYLIQMGEESEREAAKERAKQKVTLSSKYRLEDRYVGYGGVVDPEILGNEAGEVVLDIYVDYSGDVKSAKLKSATGITNEDVIEACKKAALKTSFNSNLDMDMGEKQAGTITYTFTAKK